MNYLGPVWRGSIAGFPTIAPSVWLALAYQVRTILLSNLAMASFTFPPIADGRAAWPTDLMPSIVVDVMRLPVRALLSGSKERPEGMKRLKASDVEVIDFVGVDESSSA